MQIKTTFKYAKYMEIDDRYIDTWIDDGRMDRQIYSKRDKQIDKDMNVEICIYLFQCLPTRPHLLILMPFKTGLALQLL